MKLLIFLIFSQLTGNPGSWKAKDIIDMYIRTATYLCSPQFTEKDYYYEFYCTLKPFYEALKKAYEYEKGIKDMKSYDCNAVLLLGEYYGYATLIGRIIDEDTINDCGFSHKFIIEVDTMIRGNLKSKTIEVRSYGKFVISDDFSKFEEFYFVGDTVLVFLNGDVWSICGKLRKEIIEGKIPLEDMDFGFYEIRDMFLITKRGGKKFLMDLRYEEPSFKEPYPLEKFFDLVNTVKPYEEKWQKELKNISFDYIKEKINRMKEIIKREYYEKGKKER